MGQRATIAVINEDKMTYRTSVQWSTVLDRNLGIFAHRAENEGEDMREAVFTMLNDLTRTYEHISALDAVSGDERQASREAEVGHGMAVVGGYQRDVTNRSDGAVELSRTIEEAKKDSYEYHLDGGSVGVVIEEKTFLKTGKLELFYISDITDEIKVSTVNIKALANFYKNGERRDLRKFDFRIY